MRTQHHLNQRRARLERVICESTGYLLMHRERATPVEKRNYTRALRCLRRATADLEKVIAEEAEKGRKRPSIKDTGRRR